MCHQPAGLTLLLLYRGHSNMVSEPTGCHLSQKSHGLANTEVSSLCVARWWHTRAIYSLLGKKKSKEKAVKEKQKKAIKSRVTQPLASMSPFVTLVYLRYWFTGLKKHHSKTLQLIDCRAKPQTHSHQKLINWAVTGPNSIKPICLTWW